MFKSLAEIRLMEANYMVDEIVGTTTFNIDELPRNKWEKKTFVFNDVRSVQVMIWYPFWPLFIVKYWVLYDFLYTRTGPETGGCHGQLASALHHVNKSVKWTPWKPPVFIIQSGVYTDKLTSDCSSECRLWILTRTALSGRF